MFGISSTERTTTALLMFASCQLERAAPFLRLLSKTATVPFLWPVCSATTTAVHHPLLYTATQRSTIDPNNKISNYLVGMLNWFSWPNYRFIGCFIFNLLKCFQNKIMGFPSFSFTSPAIHSLLLQVGLAIWGELTNEVASLSLPAPYDIWPLVSVVADWLPISSFLSGSHRQ